MGEGGRPITVALLLVLRLRLEAVAAWYDGSAPLPAPGARLAGETFGGRGPRNSGVGAAGSMGCLGGT